MSSVFISHSSHDAAFVEQLTRDLRAHDHRARSISDVVGGSRPLSQSELDPRLREAISADTFFLPVLTPAAVESPWIHKELEVALRSEAASDSVKILPVLNQPCLLPPELGLRSPVDFTRSYDEGLASLLSILRPPDPASAAANLTVKTSADESAIRHVREELSESHGLILSLSAKQIEGLIAEVLQELGYEVRVSFRSKDAGIDRIALSGWDDRRVPFYMQCKRYTPNHQLTFEWADSILATTRSSGLSDAMLLTTSRCFDLSKRPAERMRWRTRSRIDLGPRGWAQVFFWLAESYATNEEMEARVADARERYAVLTDKRFATQLETSEEDELRRAEALLDAAEATFYEPMKRRLRSLRDQLLAADDTKPKLN